MKNALSKPNEVEQNQNSPVIEIARSKEDLIKAFTLTQESYCKAGLSNESPSGIRITPYHLLPKSDVLIAKIHGRVVSTVSLFRDGELGLPMEAIYPQEIESLRNNGLRLAEVGSLADRRHEVERFIELLAKMGRLLAQAAHSRCVDALVAVAHPKHARLYKRVLGFQQIGEYTECPYANGNPAVALYLRFNDKAGTELYNQYFGQKIPSEQLSEYVWEKETREYFTRILDCDAKIANVINKPFHDWEGNAFANGKAQPPRDLNIFSPLR